MSCKGGSMACPDQPDEPKPGTARFDTGWVAFGPTRPPLPLPSVAYQITDKSIEQLKWAGLREWQAELREWYQQFGDVPDGVKAAKVLEEAGELGHAIVRLWLCDQNMAAAPHRRMYEAQLRDAIGDVVVTVTHLATRYGWKMEDILKDVLAELQSRKYSDDKTSHGVT